MEINFDTNKNWYILSPFPVPDCVNKLAGFISGLRRGTGNGEQGTGGRKWVSIIDGNTTRAPEDSAEIIVNYDETSQKTAFAWRCGTNRIEIYAHSLSSLEHAITDFISNVDTANAHDTLYPLLKTSNHQFN